MWILNYLTNILSHNISKKEYFENRQTFQINLLQNNIDDVLKF